VIPRMRRPWLTRGYMAVSLSATRPKSRC